MVNNNELIRNIWYDNLEEEMATIRFLIKKYNYIAMDTEFPGVVAKPLGNFNKDSTFLYQQLRCNVDILNLIQLGLSISDAQGNRPTPVSTWQFNMKFKLDEDIYSKDSIDLLLEANIDFQKHTSHGINPADLGYYLITSGLVMSPKISWISFHSSFDFAYLIKLLTGNNIPVKEAEFYKLLSILFPFFFDYKNLIKNSDLMKKGLQEIGLSLGVKREGVAHQAGSDALLTSAIFFKSKSFLDNDTIKKNMNKLFGLDYYEHSRTFESS